MFGHLDATVVARMQFAFTISAHIIFPAFSIGTASYLFVLEALYLKTRREVYLELFNFWKTIFAVVFGMGVVSGIVMSTTASQKSVCLMAQDRHDETACHQATGRGQNFEDDRFNTELPCCHSRR